MKEYPDEEIREPVDDELYPWVVDHSAALDESASKDAVPAFIELAPVHDRVGRGIGGVGHHDHAGVARAAIEPVHDGASKAVWTGILNGSQRRHFRAQGLQNLPGRIPASVVDHNDLVRDAPACQRLIEVAHH